MRNFGSQEVDEEAGMRARTWKVAAATAVAASVVGAPLVPAHAGGKEQDESTTDANAMDSLWGDDETKESKKARERGAWNAALDDGSLFSLTANNGIQRAWAQGVTGHDVTVALVDTGVAPVPGLDENDDKVIDGPDLSYESQAAGTRYIDGFGHGTHLAGIIAGNDGHFDRKKPSPWQFNGVAPEAQLLNVKVATGDGGTDVSQVIAAIDWVVEHREDAGMDVRVINLAYGTESVQPWQVDPLARAVENAWDSGIVVVAAAGNGGAEADRLTMPAVDPHVIAVGAVDHRGTADPGDDAVADFTSAGNAARRPDVLAPGKSVVSLRVPGSYADEQHPEGMVAGDGDTRFFRGSGTSQAAAVVSGQVALLLDKKPSLTPDEVKGLLMATARPLADDRSAVQGAGVTDIVKALAHLEAKRPVPAASTAVLPASSGLGSIEAARGGDHVFDPTTGIMLTGEYDALGTPWQPRAWVAAQELGETWRKGVYNGRTWTGDKWEKKQLRAAGWSGASWSGVAWEQHTWSDDQWEARSWRGRSWRARSWRAETWSARSWRSDS
jgi:serine protease AprX